MGFEIKIKIALAQMAVLGGRKEDNLTKAENMIAAAAAHGSSLVILPEAMDLGWTHPSSTIESEPIPDGSPFHRLSQAAERHKIFVCAGLTERYQNQVFNSAVIIDKNGELLCLHRKINELDIGHPYYALGDRLQVVNTELGTIGLMICADGFARDQVISRTLGYMGADIIISPCSWAVRSTHDNEAEPYGDFWRDVYKPVAKEFKIVIAAVSNVGWLEAGPWAGKKCIGSSLVIGPDGNDIFQAPYGPAAETICYVNIELENRSARGHD
jgi:predicted amidohydrolase